MSLVGSLEDLGLADILQIVSLSRKSGLLMLASTAGDGRIVFRNGLICAASVKGELEDLRMLLVGGGFVSADAFDRCRTLAREERRPIGEALAEHAGLPPEHLDSLRREHIERAVLRMFTWRTGEFSFDVRDDADEQDRDLLLQRGINAQYLTMEATRLGDEEGGFTRSEPGGGGEPVFSGDAEPMIPVPPDEDGGPAARGATAVAAEVVALAAAREADAEAAREADGGAAREAEGAQEPSERTGAPALVAVDPDLCALEWLKATLGESFARVHIFQRSEAALARVRQYLARAEVPVVIVSAKAPADPLSGAGDVVELVRRLRAPAPGMPILVMRERTDEGPRRVAGADAILLRPPSHKLAVRGAWPKLEREARELRTEVLSYRSRGTPVSADRPGRGAAAIAADSPWTLERVRETTDRLRDPTTRGEVLRQVLDFAGEGFARVAIFMLRDDVAIGMAERGLDLPPEEPFEGSSVPADQPGWFRVVRQGRRSFRGPPTDDGDLKLVGLLGGEEPAEVFIAPIESSGEVVALVYADGAAGGRDLPDGRPLEIVLHAAGMALDRAVLERALEEHDG